MYVFHDTLINSVTRDADLQPVYLSCLDITIADTGTNCPLNCQGCLFLQVGY